MTEILKKCLELAGLLEEQKALQDSATASLQKKEEELKALARDTNAKIAELSDYENVTTRLELLAENKAKNEATLKEIVAEKAKTQELKNEIAPRLEELKREEERILTDKEVLKKDWKKLQLEKETYKETVMKEFQAKMGVK